MSSKAHFAPVHLGLILDGNRRWAKENGLPQLEGHKRGYNNLINLADFIFDRGVKYLSAYIFSTENWTRTEEEVSYLMDLALKMAVRDTEKLHKKNVRVVFLGTKTKLSDTLIKAIDDAEEKTKNNTRGTLALCFNYGGHQEIADAIHKASKAGENMSAITTESIAKYLYSPEIPPVDFIIRTSGEERLSNFMLWRAAYSELYWLEKHWPAITKEDIDKAFEEYSRRNRRFGG